MKRFSYYGIPKTNFFNIYKLHSKIFIYSEAFYEEGFVGANILFALGLSACGVPQEEFDEVQKEKDNLQNKYDSLISENENLQKEFEALSSENDLLDKEYKSLKSDHEKLVEETKDWVKLTDKQKEAELAQVEADKLAAEEAKRKAEEEKLAAKKAEEEAAKKKAEEEAAAKAEEEKKGYKTGITFDDLSRNPDDFMGKKVEFTGEVLQVTELSNEVQIRLATKEASWGGYSDDVIYIYFSSDLIDSRILEEDIITVYGTSQGLHSYTTIMGGNVTLPLIEVDKIDQ